jgi:hypothetical protein
MGVGKLGGNDERRMRHALRQADGELKPADRERLGALAVIFGALVEAVRIDRLLPGDRPGGKHSRWSPIAREIPERIADAEMRKKEIDEGADPKIIFLIPASSSQVDTAETVLCVFHSFIVDQKNVSESDLRAWKILLELAGGMSPAKIAKKHRTHQQQVSRIKMAALGRILAGVRHLLPKVEMPRRRAA